MPYSKPTLTAIKTRIRQDIYAGLNLIDQVLKKTTIKILSDVYGGVINSLYGVLDWILDQPFPDTADEEFVNRWKTIKNLTTIAAEQSSGFIEATGSTGSVIPIDTELQTVDGLRYKVTAATAIAATPQDVPVISIDFGSDTVQAATTPMTFVSTPTGIDADAVVEAAGLTGGRDEETTEEIRDRVLDSFRNPPQGGNDNDYAVWANEAVDVTRTWLRTYSPGSPHGVLRSQVFLYFAMHDTYADGIPQAGDVTAVQDYIEPIDPAGAEFFALAPVADPIPFNVTIVPSNATTQAATTAELQDLMRRKGEEGGTLQYNDMLEAMGRIPGLTDWTLTAPTTDQTTAVGELHTLGTVTFA